MEIRNGKVVVPNDLRNDDDFEEWVDGTLNTIVANMEMRQAIIKDMQGAIKQIESIDDVLSNVDYRNAADDLLMGINQTRKEIEMFNELYDEVNQMYVGNYI